ncbi:hypothetical protein BDZ89DRAFT_156301 [Hymenopellis radicata]|nr:hypothetical protein BDZ89DRAFT_156301 [Hymenopellis radicata]
MYVAPSCTRVFLILASDTSLALRHSCHAMSVSLCTQCGTISKPSLQYVHELETSILLHNLRTSNVPATDHESSHIQHNILPNIDTDISSISAKIRSLQDVIASLQQERDALESVRERYRGLISPCHAVPPELWEQIIFYLWTLLDA